MKLATILHVFFFVTGICLAVTSAEDGQPIEEGQGIENVGGELDKSSNVTDENTGVSAVDPDPSVSANKTNVSSATDGTAESDSDSEASDNEKEETSGDDDTNKNEEEDEETNGEDAKEEDKNEEDVTKKKDDLNDNPQVLDPDSITDDSDARFHTVKLMLYIIAPVSALVVVYFIMKALKGNNNTFFNRYHIVGARGDNIELRPLGYDSEDEEDIVFESARRP